MLTADVIRTYNLFLHFCFDVSRQIEKCFFDIDRGFCGRLHELDAVLDGQLLAPFPRHLNEMKKKSRSVECSSIGNVDASYQLRYVFDCKLSCALLICENVLHVEKIHNALKIHPLGMAKLKKFNC